MLHWRSVKSPKVDSMTSTRKVVGALALGVGLYATVVERQLFTIRRETLPVLPAGATPLRVLHLSDLHLAPWQTRKMNWVRSLAELRPDLVVLTGDMMGHEQARGSLISTLRAFAGVPTVFVHGSNDYFKPVMKNPFKYLLSPSQHSKRPYDLDTDALTRGFEELGFTDLNNAAARMTLRGTTLDLLGLNDPHIELNDAAAMRESLADLTQSDGADASQSSPVRIGVVHAPYQRALGDLLDDGVDAIFAGHTHGGQVRVPGLGALVSNCDLPVTQARGLSVWYDAHRAAFLNVSAGLGNSIYAPVRFACRPEASLITLEASDSDQ